MAAIQGAISAAERSMRSVFVGNIPYEATEEQLKDIFSEVGPVVSFRLVYDRETGKPKGYGFCEYKDQETALSAMRNLNGYELNGRALRVDNAASEKSKEELKSLQASLGGPPAESPYGPEVDANEAPESISKAVASLPPEQMFELMKQMKLCIQNNPNEARNMLLQNPQLAYALLQAQVIMRIIDPQVALSILHRQNINAASLLPTPEKENQQSSAPLTMVSNAQPAITSQMNSFNHQQSVPVSDVNSHIGFRDTAYSSPLHGQYTAPQASAGLPNTMIRSAAPISRPSLLGDRPPVTNEAPRPSVLPQFPEPRAPDTFDPRLDPRNLGDRDMRQGLGDRDMRQPPITDRDMRPSLGDQDLRHLSPARTVTDNRIPYDPRFRNMQPEPHRAVGSTVPFDPRMGVRGASLEQQRNPFEPVRSVTGSQVRFEDPRAVPTMPTPAALGPRPPPPASRPIPANTAPTPAVPPAPQVAPRLATPSQPPISTPDQEKAALIMQVLQLSDQQIAMLPPEQRQSIMILKEQIARSAQH